MMLATMFGFVVDDISDLPADRAVGKPTALAEGRISVLQARLLSSVLAVTAVIVSPGGLHGKCVILVTLIALGFYHSLSRALPLLKGAYTAGLTCVPLLYGGLIAHVRVRVSSYVVLSMFMVGRELLIDASQADADRRTGFRTLAARWNRRAAETWARFGMLAAVALLILTAGNLRAQVLSLFVAGTVVWALYAPVSRFRRPPLLLFSVALGACAIALSV